MNAADYYGITLKMIADRCDEVGDCWIWRNAASTTGHPIIKSEGKCRLVRRAAVALDGRPAAPSQPVACTCGEKLCCNPAHLYPSSVKHIARKAAKEGAWSGVARCKKLADVRRKSDNCKLTIEIAREVRASTEKTEVLARRYGVNVSVIKGIRAGKLWKEYVATPFTGLGARR